MTTQFANDLTWHHSMAPSAPSTMHDDPHAPAASAAPDDLGRQLLRQRMFPEETPLSRIGRYTVLRFVGAGGMGQVYVAYDPDLDRRVALKLLSPVSTGVTEARMRLLREAQALAKLSHPNVVQIYEVGEASGQTYISMEFVPGQTLHAWLEESGEQAPREQLLDLFTQAGRGLAAAHAAGMIHRDFSPSNVLIDAQGLARVLDFGLATAAEGTGETLPSSELPPHGENGHGILGLQLTHTGALLGTPRYMSPEQLRGLPLDARSDQFSFCVALHEALTRETPFEGHTIMQLMDNVLGDHRREVPSFRALPRRLREALDRGLALDPDQRWASMDALLQALAPPSRTRIALGFAAVALPVLALGAWQLVGHYEHELDASAEQLASTAREGAAETERVTGEREAITQLRAAEEIELLARRPGYELEAVARGVELIAGAATPEHAPAAAVRGLNFALRGRVPLARLDHAERTLAHAAFSPDGARLVTTPLPAGDDQTAEVWSTQPPRLLHALDLDGLETLDQPPSISPDGSHVALSSSTRCSVFELEGGARVRELPNCTAPQWSTDGRTLYGEVPCADRGDANPPRFTCAIAAWELDTGTQRWTKAMLGREGTLAVHPDGEQLILRHDSRANEAVELIRTSDGRREALLEREGRGPIEHNPILDTHMALSADGSTLAVIEHDGKGRIVTWDLATREAKVIETVMPTTWGWFFASMDLSATGESLLLHGRGAGLTMFDLEHDRFAFAQPWGSSSAAALPSGWLAISEGEWQQLPGPFRRQGATSAKQLVTSTDGRFAVTVSAEGSRLWSLESQLETRVGPFPSGERALGFTDDLLVTHHRVGGLHLYTREADGSFAQTPSLTDAHHEHTQPMSVAADRPTRMVFRHDGRDAVYELGETKPVCRLPDQGEDWELDPSGTRVVAVFGEQARIWSVEDCSELERFTLPQQGMTIAGIARDGTVHLYAPRGFNYVYSGEGQGHVIDARCHREQATYSQLSPDGGTLVTNCDGQLPEYFPAMVWDSRSGALVRELDMRGFAGSPQFSPDSRALIVRANSHELAVLDIDSGLERLRVPGILFAQPGWMPHGDAHTLEYMHSGSHVRIPLSVESLVAAGCETLERAQPQLHESSDSACR